MDAVSYSLIFKHSLLSVTEVITFIACLILTSVKYLENETKMMVIFMFVVSKNKTKQKQISNTVNLFYVELNSMHFVT